MKKQTLDKAFASLRQQLRWTTASGDEIAVQDMEVQHLQNTIVYLSKKQEDYAKYKVGDLKINNLSAPEWIEIFRKELKSREV